MKFRSAMTFALVAGISAAGCAAGGAGGGDPFTSPTGRVYEPGTSPTQTAESRAATLAIATGQFESALTEARSGIALDATNPVHFFVAGQAAAGLGQYELADSMWTVATRIYPAYEIEIEPEREQAWAEAFNLGVEAYNAADADEAIRQWGGAHTIYRLRPEAAQNLAVALTQENEYEDAIRVYQEAIADLEIEPATRVIGEEEEMERAETRAAMVESLAQLLLYTDDFAQAEALFREQLALNPDDVEVLASLASAVSRQGRADEANEIYNRLLEGSDLPPGQLFNIGVSLFNAGDHLRAAEAFGRVTDVQPNSRDAWYNAANALYAGEYWEELVPVAEELVDVDPLNENTGLILARAYRETEQNQQALEALQRIEGLPIFVEELQLRPAGERTTVRGSITGNAATAGSPIQIRFTFYNDTAEVGSTTVDVQAPAAEQSTNFEATVQANANAYRYQLVN